MNLKTIHNVYLIGIGGIGMSALARYFKFIGKQVAGYDKNTTKLTAELQHEGIGVHDEDSLLNIPPAFKTKNTTLIIYTPAIPKQHNQLNYFKNKGFRVHKRAEVLGWITKETYCFAVAGTHGKTTISSILAHILKETNTPVTAFLGGISENFNSNMLIAGNDYTVVEADEFDRSFLHLSPDVACVTSMDADHLDIYGEKSELEQSFSTFAANLKPNGKLLIRNGLPLQGMTYGIDDASDYSVKNIKIKHTTYTFDIVTPGETIKDVTFNIPGKHNVLNALAAFAMATQIGISKRNLARALTTFKGIKRRFSYQINTEELIYIDDYAHHPTEIKAVYHTLREVHPGKTILAIFQPHLFSRTRDFADEFAESLSPFDAILLLDIYPAREQPIEGVTSTWLLSKINNPNKKMTSKGKLIAELKASKAQVVLTIGAGDIGEEVKHIKKALLS
ncbi:MAG: UDP-N-acetylmuramate--L-alanine ligase [Bacteroidota bacterium]